MNTQPDLIKFKKHFLYYIPFSADEETLQKMLRYKEKQNVE